MESSDVTLLLTRFMKQTYIPQFTAIFGLFLICHQGYNLSLIIISIVCSRCFNGDPFDPALGVESLSQKQSRNS